MEKIVARITGKPRCEVFPCKARAEIAIGPRNRKPLCYNICLEHGRQIKDGLIELFTEIDAATAGIAETPQIETHPAEDKPIAESYNTEYVSDDTIPGVEGNTATTPQTEPLEPIPVPIDSTADAYICKFCGSTFKKPDELNLYRSHIANCPSKPRKQK